MVTPAKRIGANPMRIHLRLGRRIQKFIITDATIPRVGDLCTLNGQDWTVTKVEAVKGIEALSTDQQGRLKQVFP